MRVLHVVGRSQGRGAELAALELAAELDALGHENQVIACNRAFDRTAHPDLTPLTNRVRMGPPALLDGVVRLRRLLSRNRFDAVLAHGGWAVEVAAFARPAGGPLLVWQRILGFPARFWHVPRRQWWRAIASRTDAAVALTPEMEAELRRLGFDRPIWVIPNFRRPERFTNVDRAAESARLRAELGIASDVPLIGIVGHLIEQKRPERAVEVLRRLEHLGVHAHLAVAGDGPLRDAIAGNAAGAGLGENVHMLGHRHDVERVLGGIDVLVLTSDDEGIPGVVIEAQMTGCPVVTFPFAAASALIAEHQTGIVLPEPDTQRMAEAVAALLADREARRQMGELGRARALSFSAERAAARYETCITELVQRRRLDTGSR